MIPEERLNQIIEYINRHQYASINSLMDLVGASKSTIRRDLIGLHEAGKITFVRGGAASINKTIIKESVYHEKEGKNTIEKQRIGKAAAAMIHSGDTVFITAGTTCRSILPFLEDLNDVRLVTNDILIAVDMADKENVNVLVTGGQLRRNYYTLLGYSAEEYISNLQVETAFISCDAVDPQRGLYIANVDEVGLFRQVINSACYVVLLADHSKFYSNAFISVCDWSKVDMVITDSELSDEIVSILKKKEIELVTV